MSDSVFGGGLHFGPFPSLQPTALAGRVCGTVWGPHFGSILGVWGDSGFRARLGRRLGRLVGDFGGLDGPNLGPKMASSWGLDRTKIDANIARIFDAFENRNLDGKN